MEPVQDISNVQGGGCWQAGGRGGSVLSILENMFSVWHSTAIIATFMSKVGLQ
jgi:hypothetical protein